MKVILAGYSKTGTKSVNAAFGILGLNTYDYIDNYYYLYKEWMKIFHGKATHNDIRKMFEGVDALTDCPSSFYWEELLEAFPEAKIILTIRDEDAWYQSLMRQFDVSNRNFIPLMLNTFWIPGYFRMGFRQYTRRFYGEPKPWPSSWVVPHHEKLLRAYYRQHNQDIIKKVPKDKLLVYKVSEGWEPLCEFLGVEIPKQPFPHKNQRATIYKEWLESNSIIRRIIVQSAASMLFIFACAGYAGYRLYNSNTWKTFLA